MSQYRETVRLTKGFAISGQGRYADFHRARSHGLLVVMELQRTEEDAAIASGNLAQLPRLDQSVMLESPPAPLELVVLTPLDTDLSYLVEFPATNHHKEEALTSPQKMQMPTRPYIVARGQAIERRGRDSLTDRLTTRGCGELRMDNRHL